MDSGKPRRNSVRSDMGGITDCLVEKPMNGPEIAPHFFGVMLYKELHSLCRQHGYHNAAARPPLFTRLLAMDQMARKQDREDPENECQAAKKRPISSALHPAFVVNREVVKQHGQWWDSTVKDNWGALPGANVDGVDAAISAWAADLRNRMLGKELSKGEAKEVCEPREGGSRSRAWSMEGGRSLSPHRLKRPLWARDGLPRGKSVKEIRPYWLDWWSRAFRMRISDKVWLRRRDALASSRRIYNYSPCVPWRSGESGSWISEIRSSKRTPSIVMYLRSLALNGIRFAVYIPGSYE